MANGVKTIVTNKTGSETCFSWASRDMIKAGASRAYDRELWTGLNSRMRIAMNEDLTKGRASIQICVDLPNTTVSVGKYEEAKPVEKPIEKPVAVNEAPKKIETAKENPDVVHGGVTRSNPMDKKEAVSFNQKVGWTEENCSTKLSEKKPGEHEKLVDALHEKAFNASRADAKGEPVADSISGEEVVETQSEIDAPAVSAAKVEFKGKKKK